MYVYRYVYHVCELRGAGTAPAGPASAGPIIANFFFFFFFSTHQAVKMSVPEKFHPSKSHVFPVRKFVVR